MSMKSMIVGKMEKVGGALVGGLCHFWGKCGQELLKQRVYQQFPA